MEINHRKGFQYSEEEADEAIQTQKEKDDEDEHKNNAAYEEEFDYEAKKKEENKDDFLDHIADSLFRAFVLAAIIKLIQFIYQRYFDPELLPSTTDPTAEIPSS